MNIRRVLRNATAMICLVVISTAGRAEDTRDVKAEYAKFVKAVIARNVKAVMATGIADFSYTENGKTMTGAEVSAYMKQQFRTIKGTPKYNMVLTYCEVSGNTAAVNTLVSSEMEILGADGKPHLLVGHGKSKDELIKTDKGWQMKSIDILIDVEPYGFWKLESSSPPPLNLR